MPATPSVVGSSTIQVPGRSTERICLRPRGRATVISPPDPRHFSREAAGPSAERLSLYSRRCQRMVNGALVFAWHCRRAATDLVASGREGVSPSWGEVLESGPGDPEEIGAVGVDGVDVLDVC